MSSLALRGHLEMACWIFLVDIGEQKNAVTIVSSTPKLVV